MILNRFRRSLTLGRSGQIVQASGRFVTKETVGPAGLLELSRPSVIGSASISTRTSTSPPKISSPAVQSAEIATEDFRTLHGNIGGRRVWSAVELMDPIRDASPTRWLPVNITSMGPESHVLKSDQLQSAKSLVNLATKPAMKRTNLLETTPIKLRTMPLKFSWKS